MQMSKCLNFLALLLIIAGALNWGLWGFFQFDFVAWIFHGNTMAWSRFVYGVIGVAGIWSLGFLCKCCCGLCKCSCHDTSGKGKGGGCCKM